MWSHIEGTPECFNLPDWPHLSRIVSNRSLVLSLTQIFHMILTRVEILFNLTSLWERFYLRIVEESNVTLSFTLSKYSAGLVSTLNTTIWYIPSGKTDLLTSSKCSLLSPLCHFVSCHLNSVSVYITLLLIIILILHLTCSLLSIWHSGVLYPQ